MVVIFYIPLKALDPDLEELIPSHDTIRFTSMVQAQEMGLFTPKKQGQLALTENGFAFRVGKPVRDEEGVLSDVDQGYVPYSAVFDLRNKRKAVKLRFTPDDRPKESRGWVFKVQCCVDFGETRDAFKQRQALFGGLFDHLYKQSTGVGVPREGLHLFASIEGFRGQLLGILPPEDTIYYSSFAKIIKTGVGGSARAGVVILTDTGVVIWGERPKGVPEHFLDFSGWAASFKGRARDYIPYELIRKYKDLRKKVRIIHTPREGSGGERGWILQIVPTKGERKESWIQRRLRFGEIFEQLRATRVEEIEAITRRAQKQLGEPFHIPLGLLPWELKVLIPSKDSVIYTSNVMVKQKARIGGSRRKGMLILTDGHFVFRAPVVTRSKALEGAIPYDLITDFENKGSVVRLTHLLEDPKERQELEFTVQQCRQFWESRAAFDRRKEKFGSIFEDQYRSLFGA